MLSIKQNSDKMENARQIVIRNALDHIPASQRAFLRAFFGIGQTAETIPTIARRTGKTPGHIRREVQKGLVAMCAIMYPTELSPLAQRRQAVKGWKYGHKAIPYLSQKGERERPKEGINTKKG